MRTTNDKKDNVIRIRLNDEMYDYLIKRSKITGNTVSDVVRLIIQKDMRNK
jgi:predicted DNA-binding protein